MICEKGLYRPYDGASQWQKQHESTTQNDTLRVWARQRDTGETEYRLVSRVDHLLASDFLEVQLNIKFRKDWDTWVKELTQLECEEGASRHGPGEACVYRWVQTMPGRLLYPREYIYLREVFHDPEEKLITILARDIPGYTEKTKNVPVEKYRSCMMIKYDDEDKPGFTYLITYHDDVSKVLPRVFTRWANGAGARWSHDKVLDKAAQLAQERAQSKTTLDRTNKPVDNAAAKTHA